MIKQVVVDLHSTRRNVATSFARCSCHGSAPARSVRMGDHPVVWTNPHYRARNVYFQFGHKPDLFQNGAFRTLFLNAIRWASER